MTNEEAIKEARSKGLPPGTVIGGGMYVPWDVSDLDPNDTVQFIPQDIASVHFNLPSVNGKRLLMLDVNGLQALYEVGTLTTTNRFFYNVYQNVLDQAIALEEFKQGGKGRYGTPWPGLNWVYVPSAATFAMDLEGRPLKGSGWYEFDKDGFPIAINNIKKIASLYFDGSIDLNLSKKDVAELLLIVIKVRVKNLFNKLRRKK